MQRDAAEDTCQRYSAGGISNRCPLGHLFSIAVDLILFKLSDNQEIHGILDEFEFWPDKTTDNRVSCPLPP